MESLEFYRKSIQIAALRVHGAATLSNLYAAKGVPPHAEQRVMELPIYTASQQPMQDPVTGRRYWIAGLDDPSSTLPRRP